MKVFKKLFIDLWGVNKMHLINFVVALTATFLFLFRKDWTTALISFLLAILFLQAGIIEWQSKKDKEIIEGYKNLYEDAKKLIDKQQQDYMKLVNLYEIETGEQIIENRILN